MLRHGLLVLLISSMICACQPTSNPVLPATQSFTTPIPTHTFFSPDFSQSPTTTATVPEAAQTPDPVQPVVSSIATQTSIPVPPQPSPSALASSTVPTTTLLFTGVIVPARCVQAALDAKGNPDYPYDEVRQIISSADLAVGAFNATMSNKIQHTGCQHTWQLVGSPENADAMARAGFDLMSVATNHIKDCGLMKGWCDFALFDTLENLQRVNILTVGAGKNLEQALQPVVITLNGVRFSFISLGDSRMDSSVFASSDNPGIAFLNEENIKTAIATAREISDVVIALPHWGPEDASNPNWNQRQQARQLVAAGADLVVGNHTHVVQGIQQINGVQVFYGLGNFVFDQDLPDHRQGVILLVRFLGRHYAGYELIPIHVDPDGRVHISAPSEANQILQRMMQASQTLR
jgi:poly-gamma-glutamate synthesis protein (capsule biosynthesis protein)